MAIREKHRHVDSAGQCYMPYLHQWQHQRQPGNLISLLSQLQEIFSQDPPVYAKPQPQNVIMQQQPAAAAVAVGHTFVQHTPIKEDENQLLNKKLVAHAASLASQIEADNAKMLLIYERLSDGAQWLTHCKEQVLQTKKKLEEILLVTMQQDEKLSHWLSTQDHALQADKAFVPTDALSLQIYQAVAEDAAIEDVLYYYDKALHQGKISLDFFLKMTRSLCCEQFQKRAIAAKIFQHQQNNKS
ncbi:ESCRT-I complex subunit VPS23, variant 2 [Balamuthia mandrillaris]